jgi:hypothetical protein
VKTAMIAAVVAMLAPVAALADPAADRCTRGAELARANDLPRAAIYLEACDTPAADDVARKLRASQLSSLSIVTDPAGMTAETTALPGETFTSPTTVWARPGTYTIRATTATGVVLSTTVKLGSRMRASVVLTAPIAKTGTPHDGKADFTDEAMDPPQDGPPPPVPHKSLLPCKYTGCDTHGGEELADPLATEAEFLPPSPAAYRIGMRAGIGAAGHTGGSRIGPSLAIAATTRAPWSAPDATHPFELGLRVDWSRRGGDDAKLDAFGASLGIDRVIAAPDAAWISVGIAARLETRVTDAMGIDHFGLGGAATLELALRKLPIVVGARYEQGLTELATGVHEHVILVELGGDLRAFTR